MHNVYDIRDLTSKVVIKYDVTVHNIWKTFKVPLVFAVLIL